MNMGRIIPMLIFVIFLSACSMQPVKPWERDVLAQKKMQLEPYPNDAFLDDHIYFSKEASRGGAGAGGGGCGCN
ncbi:putative lipoprotein [hydrothermal vent metagenome]|uniref:Putative lipoprotein n=1 Tax=hydrothermal vent metagenome TaxID=652676 RepID=A0A3B0ZBC2_9ZZZZ